MRVDRRKYEARALAAYMQHPSQRGLAGFDSAAFTVPEIRAVWQCADTMGYASSAAPLSLWDICTTSGVDYARLADVQTFTVHTVEQVEAAYQALQELIYAEQLQDTVQRAAQDCRTPREYLDKMEQVLSEAPTVARGGGMRPEYELFWQYLQEAREHLESGDDSAIPCPWPSVARFCRPAGGEVTLIAAQGGAGKSTWFRQWQVHLAHRRIRSACFQMEMTPRQLFRAECHRVLDRPTAERLTAQQLDQASRMVDYLAYMYVDTTPGLTPQQMLGIAQKLEDVVLIGIDTAKQVVIPGKPQAAGWERIEPAVMGAKILAKATNAHVVVLSHLNRRNDDDAPPTLQSILGGGHTDADSVLVLQRPAAGSIDASKLYRLKARAGGTTGYVELIFNGRNQSFREMTDAFE